MLIVWFLFFGLFVWFFLISFLFWGGGVLLEHCLVIMIWRHFGNSWMPHLHRQHPHMCFLSYENHTWQSCDRGHPFNCHLVEPLTFVYATERFPSVELPKPVSTTLWQLRFEYPTLCIQVECATKCAPSFILRKFLEYKINLKVTQSFLTLICIEWMKCS